MWDFNKFLSNISLTIKSSSRKKNNAFKKATTDNILHIFCRNNNCPYGKSIRIYGSTGTASYYIQHRILDYYNHSNSSILNKKNKIISSVWVIDFNDTLIYM